MSEVSLEINNIGYIYLKIKQVLNSEWIGYLILIFSLLIGNILTQFFDLFFYRCSTEIFCNIFILVTGVLLCVKNKKGI
ncbi:positive regulator of sigma E activity [Clostridium moniliforme]|uniref:Positive regulator of sigma E activity n=1 Tax=Clostridium moniliforme TaxID=39489 RepID=A0ABS4F1K1_9CLOT|nr:hypothetical protein [Clostridium moniliforme]MBP1890134.1 positive regulator of sigma E activity [Clostridium moniliforme]